MTAVAQMTGEPGAPARFRHEALLYAGTESFLDGVLPFLREGLGNDEDIYVVLDEQKIDVLRRELGPTADRIVFDDMAQVGANPARIIPAWKDFAEHRRPGASIRGVGEPIWASRTRAELVEYQRHEALLNIAFDTTEEFRLLCPYDTATLDAAVLAEARNTHPIIVEADAARSSPTFGTSRLSGRRFEDPLSEPADVPHVLVFTGMQIQAVREFARGVAAGYGLAAERMTDLVLAVNEIATNSIRHGGGAGVLRMWADHGSLISEVADSGVIDEPLLGRVRPKLDQEGGHGVWLATQLCDLIQIRSYPTGSAVRLHMSLQQTL
ncbi:MAG TPA: sensor histidine kinase [Acidothermaceae bacterium]|nr:sensor histidine kinase [Acidothermaceae bacterium]